MTTTVEKSQRLARWLRHRPDAIGLALDRHGWADVADLLTKVAAAGMPITAAELAQLVADNDKQRFAFNDDQTRIRAVQGHSSPVDLQLPVKIPRPVLYHSTVARFLSSIRKQGLLPGSPARGAPVGNQGSGRSGGRAPGQAGRASG
jgi:putative RNA 2'-phosphotransferase